MWGVEEMVYIVTPTPRTRLKAKNLLYINQLLHILTCLTKVLAGGSVLPLSETFGVRICLFLESPTSRHKGAQHEGVVCVWWCVCGGVCVVVCVWWHVWWYVCGDIMCA